MEGVAAESRRDMWAHVVLRYYLWLSQPTIHGHRKQAKTCGSKEGNQCFPVLGVSIIHRGGLGPRSANIWRAWSMGEDAPLISGIKDRHCAMDDALY
jgi:hypothetical protein